MIDWDQPIETTETPPRPVRVLATDAGGAYPIVVLLNGAARHYDRDGTHPLGAIPLRNVAPPKPCPTCTNKPCVNDGRFSESVIGRPRMTDDLIKRLRLIKGVCDEAADALEAQAKRIAELDCALKNDNLAYKQGLHDGREERDELCAEIRKLQDASRMWGFEQMKLRNRAEKAESDLAAVRAAFVRWTATAVPGCSDWEIIAAARDEQPSPEKSCKTCARLIREEGACGLYGVSLCSGFDKWQPKSDVCPTCEGKGRREYLHYHHRCNDCGGTGKKETK